MKEEIQLVSDKIERIKKVLANDSMPTYTNVHKKEKQLLENILNALKEK